MTDDGQPGRIADAPVLSRNLKRLLQVRSALILCQAALVAFSLVVPITIAMLLVLFVLSLFAGFIANDRPLVIHYKGEWLFPVLHNYSEDRFGAERARRICSTSRNLGIFPNLVINDIMAVTVRTFYPVAPDYMEVNAWSLAPIDESAEDSAIRLDNFLTFLGPGGFATPDDVEMLESCQRGFANREVEWSDISRGMKREAPSVTDELQMRAFWRRWNNLMTAPQIRSARRAA